MKKVEPADIKQQEQEQQEQQHEQQLQEQQIEQIEQIERTGQQEGGGGGGPNPKAATQCWTARRSSRSGSIAVCACPAAARTGCAVSRGVDVACPSKEETAVCTGWTGCAGCANSVRLGIWAGLGCSTGIGCGGCGCGCCSCCGGGCMCCCGGCSCCVCQRLALVAYCAPVSAVLVVLMVELTDGRTSTRLVEMAADDG